MASSLYSNAIYRVEKAIKMQTCFKSITNIFYRIQNCFRVLKVRFYERRHTIKLQQNNQYKQRTFNRKEIISSEKTLIIQIPFGGLGDNLFYSHIPRIAKQTGKYDKVYISNYSEFRNVEYRTLIWEINPFVDGFCDVEGINAVYGIKEDEYGVNLLDQIMLFYGLDDKKRFHEPEIYYTPTRINSLQNSIVYDPNYISNAGDISFKTINSYFNRHTIYIDYQMKLRDKSFPIISFKHSLETPTIMDFCDVLISCKDLFCLTSGTATLAATLHKPATIFFGEGVKKIFHHSRLHNYIQV